MAMGDLARSDEYGDTLPLPAEPPPLPQQSWTDYLRSIGGRIDRGAVDAARTVPGAIVRGGIEAAKFAGNLGALDDPEMEQLGQQGMQEAERQAEAQLYQPQTTAGEYTNAVLRTLANPFNALGPGTMLAKQGVNALAGLAGEYGAQSFPDHPDLARFVFGFGPGVAGHAMQQAERLVPQGSLGMGAGKMIIPQRTPEVSDAMGSVAAPAPLRSAEYFGGAAQRDFSPGIYKDPRVIAQEASAMVAPEHPALKQLFGVTREDLYDISKQGTRRGDLDPRLATKIIRGGGSGSYAADAIMNPRNAQRQIDALAEAERYPQLTHPMDAWYVMDPMFQQMVKLVGRKQAIKDYTRFNATTAPFSAGSDVPTEIIRGTGANMMAARGDYPTFARYAGMAEKDRGPNFPADLRDIPGHAYHSTAQSPAVERYLATGEHGYSDDALKIWLYHQASGVPETGFQTKYPVLDAHLARSSGMSDVRTDAKPGRNMKGPEYRAFAPWYSENVAAPLGIEAVPAQGRQWGVFAPQTGVDTPIGAPKLELIAQSIWERAKRLGIDPAVLRDQVLRGENHATWMGPAILAGAAARGRMGDTAASDQYD